MSYELIGYASVQCWANGYDHQSNNFLSEGELDELKAKEDWEYTEADLEEREYGEGIVGTLSHKTDPNACFYEVRDVPMPRDLTIYSMVDGGDWHPNIKDGLL